MDARVRGKINESIGDCDQDLQSRGISIVVTIRLIVRLIPTYGCREREELILLHLGL